MHCLMNLCFLTSNYFLLLLPQIIFPIPHQLSKSSLSILSLQPAPTGVSCASPSINNNVACSPSQFVSYLSDFDHVSSASLPIEPCVVTELPTTVEPPAEVAPPVAVEPSVGQLEIGLPLSRYGVPATFYNAHSMQTRSKKGIFKLKTYVAAVLNSDRDLVNQEPLTIKQVLSSPHWF